MELSEFLEELLFQGQRYFAAYTIIFIAAVLNSLQICLGKRRKRSQEVLQILEGFLLIIAMGLMYLANVLVIDAAGRDFYMRTKKIDTLSFVFIIIGLLFFAGSIIIYFLNKKNKKSD